eukprot:gb/GECG01007539.1/.p1 GENE.gb/GECG01007539.1/~~gb/GECG01007539.1/.p1  ORF type:complete len:352 (+),score=23.58 gb/GECG01007539.1/:1-1056(+)
MKLDVSNLRYLTQDHFRVLHATEMGMRNHEIVPVELIESIADLKRGGVHLIIKELLKYKLVAHDRRSYDGYRLSYPGFDYLALKALLRRGAVDAVGYRIGVGKESDIFLAKNSEEEQIVLKFQRLGRISFRSVKQSRDYLQHRKTNSWLYMSRLGAMKEYAFMKVLHDNGFPTPTPIDQNRHCIAMSLVPGKVMSQAPRLENPENVYNECMNYIIRFAECGLIHCDFNEFNIMISLVDGVERITIIDFPQMVSVDHPNAHKLFDRDVHCIVNYFAKKYNFSSSYIPDFKSVETTRRLDVDVEASGFSHEHRSAYEEVSASYSYCNEQVPYLLPPSTAISSPRRGVGRVIRE